MEYIVMAEFTEWKNGHKRVLTNVGFLPLDMVGPGHTIGAKVFKTKGGAQRKASRFNNPVFKCWVEQA